MAAFPLPQSSATPDDYVTFPVSPEMAGLEALGVTLIAAIVITFVVIGWRDWRANRAARDAECICGHGRLRHKGYDERHECLVCRCRHYIRKAPAKDWHL